MSLSKDELINGTDDLEGLVNLEIQGDEVVLFIQDEDGEVAEERYDMEYWMLTSYQHEDAKSLKGDLFYDNIWIAEDFNDYFRQQKLIQKNRHNWWYSYNQREMAILRDGMTYFKGLHPKDVSILGYDIETSGLKYDDDSEVFCISNTYRGTNGRIKRKLFSLDDYENSYEMIMDWCKWVRKMNPTIITGHNIYKYDFKYLLHVIKLYGKEHSLPLGRDGSDINIPKRDSKFRIDGSREDYFRKYRIFGREIVDTFHLTVRYDAQSKKYDNYQLKHIIEVEKLVKKGRVFYDASKIGENWSIKKEREKIKKYCIDDGDDAIALYDLMIPAYFYLCQSVPKTFEDLLISASGSQLNNMMIRGYLAEGHSIPEPDEVDHFQGAFSYGNAGVYNNVFKIDVASLYPSIMRQFKIYDHEKDPLKHLLTYVETFTIERLKNKKLAKDTGDKYYDDLQKAQKIVINSFYGFLGATGLHFNSPFNASEVTRYGREILNHSAIYFCGGEFVKKDGEVTWDQKYDDNEFNIVNADTDSISFTKLNQTKFSKEEIEEIVDDINEAVADEVGELIVWEDDGLFDVFVVLKTKNYAMKKNKAYCKRGESPISFKGSSIKDTKCEKVLQGYKKEILNLFLAKKQDQFFHLYMDYVKRIFQIGTDEEPIDVWAVKKTITKSVLNAERKQEQDILDACEGKEISLEDRVFLYRTEDGRLKLLENYEGDHHTMHYIKRLYASTKIFEKVLDLKLIPDYTLKNNIELLNDIVK